jgi:RNA polymerase sigma-70 factor (ECF subfamily)
MPDVSLERFRSALLLLARAQLARQRLPDDSASDLVQNTLCEAHRDLERFRGQTEAELFAWLRKALHHNFLDACNAARAGKRAVERTVREAELTQSFAGLDELLVAPDTSPSERAARGEELTRLARALEQLREENRQQHEAVLLKHLAGLTLVEVSERLGCTPKATVAFPDDQERVMHLVYPVFAALSGMAAFATCSKMSRKLYVLPALGWVVSIVMAFHLEWAPILYGLFCSTGVPIFGLYLRRLGKELE